MQRRSFFKWIFSTAIPLLVPRWARAQVSALAADDLSVLRELASVVLPGALGRARTDEIAGQFVQWIRDYKPGADMGHGYGFTRLQVAGPNPSMHYAEQLRQLDAAAAAKGTPFAKLNAADKRVLVEAALEEAKIDGIPPRPNGKHVATDLMSHFLDSADGEDFLYGVGIKRDSCRGLSNSGQRPAPLH